MRTPNFEDNLLRVLKGQCPERATLFEIIIDRKFYPILAGHEQEIGGELGALRFKTEALAKAGYDIAPCYASNFRICLPKPKKTGASVSLNDNTFINDWESFEKYPWPDPKDYDTSTLEKIIPYMPEGMKLLSLGPGGVLENVMDIVGYDNLCIMLYEEPELVQTIFDHVGERIIKYYEAAVGIDSVGVICSNDDWGFNTQTFLSPDNMRKYVFPWHKKIVDLAHKNGKPCMLHSCGNYSQIIDDVIDDMKYDGRHSYEDNIIPVEKAYADLKGRIPVLGGIDLNFLLTKTPNEIYTRCRNMLDLAKDFGGYALGSGNSITQHVPIENYLAMLRAAWDV